jgi:hypothetical protein
MTHNIYHLQYSDTSFCSLLFLPMGTASCRNRQDQQAVLVVAGYDQLKIKERWTADGDRSCELNPSIQHASMCGTRSRRVSIVWRPATRIDDNILRHRNIRRRRNRRDQLIESRSPPQVFRSVTTTPCCLTPTQYSSMVATHETKFNQTSNGTGEQGDASHGFPLVERYNHSCEKSWCKRGNKTMVGLVDVHGEPFWCDLSAENDYSATQTSVSVIVIWQTVCGHATKANAGTTSGCAGGKHVLNVLRQICGRSSILVQKLIRMYSISEAEFFHCNWFLLHDHRSFLKNSKR